MNLKRFTTFIVIGMFLMTTLTFVASGEPSTKNPRRQDAVWNEENVSYNITYLANNNVSARIVSPDIFEFKGNGTVVMWQTVWTEEEEIPTQQHIVMKIADDEIIWKKINNLSAKASLKATDNPAPEKNTERNSITLFPITDNEIAEKLQELREKFLELGFPFSS